MQTIIFGIVILIVIVIIVVSLIATKITIKKVNTRTCLDCGTKIEDKKITHCPNCGNPLK